MGLLSSDQITFMNEMSDKLVTGIKNSFFSENVLLKRLMAKKKSDIGDAVYVPITKQNAMVGDIKDPTQLATALKGIFKKDGDLKTPKNNDIIARAKFTYASAGETMGLTDSEVRQVERAPGELKNIVKAKFADFDSTIRLGIGYSVFEGLADSVDPVQLAGFTKSFDNTYALGGLDPATYTFWKSKVYDFTTGGTYFGYVSANVDTRSELISTTGSKTPNLPVIIDLIRSAIYKATLGTDKPTLVLMSRDLWEVANAAYESMSQGRAAASTIGKDPLLVGFDAFYIGTIPVVADDMRINDVSVTPQNKIWILNENYLDLYFHKGDEFKMSGWKNVENQWFVSTNSISVVASLVHTMRNRQSIITFPAINYDA